MSYYLKLDRPAVFHETEGNLGRNWLYAASEIAGPFATLDNLKLHIQLNELHEDVDEVIKLD